LGLKKQSLASEGGRKRTLLALRQGKMVNALWQKSWAHTLWEKLLNTVAKGKYANVGMQ